MIIEDMVSAIKLAWQMAPFPFLFLLIIVAGFVWLWVECQSTRLLRATPGWRRPAPIMPGISLVSVGIIRVLWILMWLWLVLFIVLAITVGLALGNADVPAPVVDGALGVGRVWNQGYRLLADRLPDEAPDWLRPAPVEPADLLLPLIRPVSVETRASPTQVALGSPDPATTPDTMAVVETPTATPLPAVTAEIAQNANVRNEPSTAAASLGIARVGRSYPITGRNGDSTWLRIDFADEDGWVFTELVAVEGDLEAVAVMSP
jgi:hypothetical protein